MRAAGSEMAWRCRDVVVTFGARPLIMGILNVTPDSFSDGNRYFDGDRAVERGLQMAAEGADIIDVGGESTRPGAEPVGEKEEARRVAPVIKRLREALAEPGRMRDGRRVMVSVDTMKSGVAALALGEGADIINDVSALTHDPAMADVARDAGAGVVLMHMQGTPQSMQKNPVYGDVVTEVAAWLKLRMAALVAKGLDPESMAVDPGIGFGKTVRHNLELLAGLRALEKIGRPVVVGLSRKSFLGAITGRDTGDRLAAGIAAMSFCVMNGANVMRVHDVRESADAAKVLCAIAAGPEDGQWKSTGCGSRRASKSRS